MVFILDGSSEIGAQVGSDLDCLICIRPLFTSRAVKNLIFFFRKDQFSFKGAQNVFSYHFI